MRREVSDGLMVGLYLIVQPSGAKSWAVRFRTAGKPKKLTLGSYPGIDLASARRLARAALVAVAEGRDPCREKKDARRGSIDSRRKLFDIIVADFIKHHVELNSRFSYARETKRLLSKEILPAFGGRRITEIDKRDVRDLLDAIRDRGGGLSGNWTLACLKRLFSWAIERDLIAASPCASIKAPVPERSRDRVLSDDELRLIWSACDEIGWPFGPFVKLLILTAQRRCEVAGMMLDELNLEEGVWILPAGRRKNGETNLVPLSATALEIIKSLPSVPNSKGYLFTTNGATAVSGFSRAKAGLDEAMRTLARNEILAWRLHDIRRTAATNMNRLGADPHVIEAVLGHNVKGVAAVYNRYQYFPEKCIALQRWEKLILSVIDSVSIPTARADAL